jgi:hypothetical protein
MMTILTFREGTAAQTAKPAVPQEAKPARATLGRVPAFGRRVSLALRPCAAAAALAWLICGCAHSHGDGSGAEAVLTPPVPPFLNGPMAVLLTNTQGFAAHVSLQTRYGANPHEAFSGELLGRGNQLLFQPLYANKWEKALRKAGLSFLWDVAEGRGYVFSEALQAYAPYSSGYRATNVLFSALNQGPEKIEGYRCAPQEATVVSSEGTVAVFEVFRASEANGFPLRISAPPGASPLILNLSSLRLVAPAADQFQVPNGFTRYESAERMLGELSVRQANLKRKEPVEPVDSDQQPGGIPGRRPNSQ